MGHLLVGMVIMSKPETTNIDDQNMKLSIEPKTTKLLWLILAYDPKTGEKRICEAYMSEHKARERARDFIGGAEYISLQSLEVADV